MNLNCCLAATVWDEKKSEIVKKGGIIEVLYNTSVTGGIADYVILHCFASRINI